jgi:hypothetical protein
VYLSSDTIRVSYYFVVLLGYAIRNEDLHSRVQKRNVIETNGNRHTDPQVADQDWLIKLSIGHVD